MFSRYYDIDFCARQFGLFNKLTFFNSKIKKYKNPPTKNEATNNYFPHEIEVDLTSK